jgi:hypothetical protein
VVYLCNRRRKSRAGGRQEKKKESARGIDSSVFLTVIFISPALSDYFRTRRDKKNYLTYLSVLWTLVCLFKKFFIHELLCGVVSFYGV